MDVPERGSPETMVIVSPSAFFSEGGLDESRSRFLKPEILSVTVTPAGFVLLVILIHMLDLHNPTSISADRRISASFHVLTRQWFAVGFADEGICRDEETMGRRVN